MYSAQSVNLLRGRRAALGMSQTDVASRLSRTASWLSLIENGYYEPDDRERERLAEILRCRVADIFPEAA
jgi:transcriptional regulator with XRE-family HTH domain